MQLSLVEKPREEIVSLEEVKNYLRISHDFDDSLLDLIIKSTREAMESIIQKSVMVQTWAYTINNDSICYNGVNEDDFPVICYDIIRIPLPKPPVAKIISVKIDNQEIDNQHYRLEKFNSRFCLCLSSAEVLNARRKASIIIEYEAGISDKKENIPYQLKLANLMLIANAYQERYSYNQNSVISQGVKRLLEPFLNLRIF
jgi:hypothetical protein